MLTAMAGFALLAGLLTIVPGVDTVLVLQAAATRGRAVAAATVAGICTGLLIWGVAAALGVSALLAASRTAFDVLQVAGAVYLLWLGSRLLRGAVGPRPEAVPGLPPPPPAVADLTTSVERCSSTAQSHRSGEIGQRRRAERAREWAGFRRGLLTNLLNPKIGVFYLAVLPQFVPPDVPAAAAGVALALVHVLETTLWFAVVIGIVHLARTWFARESVRRWIDAVSGTALVGFGLVLLARRAAP